MLMYTCMYIHRVVGMSIVLCVMCGGSVLRRINGAISVCEKERDVSRCWGTH